MPDLLEKRPLPDIRAFFAARDLPMVAHRTPPPITGSALRRLPRLVRRALAGDPGPYWVDLGTVWPHYGSGTSEEEAIRRAARRYRVEQSDPEASGMDP